MKKKILVTILATLMVMMLIPAMVMTASAADGPEAVWGTSADDLGGEGREGTLAQAVAAAAVADSNVKYIKMNRDVDITRNNNNSFGISSGDFTLDMGGYELSWGWSNLRINGGKVVFKNGTFTSAWSYGIYVDGDTESTEITFESGTYNNPSGSLVYVGSAKQLAVKKDVTMQAAGTPLVIGSNCAASVIEGASLTGNGWDITRSSTASSTVNSTVKITAGIYDIDCYSGSLDLTDHPDPTGTIILDAQGENSNAPSIKNVENIVLPEGYGLFDQYGTLYTEGTCYGRLTVRKLHEHVWEYTASGTTITATCIAEGCDNTDGESVSIAVPDSVEYTGSAIEAKVTNTLPTDVTVTVVYTGEDLVDGKPVRNGTYTAKITLGEQEISVEYTIIHSAHDCVYPESTDTEHKESCGCGYEATVPHAFDEDTGICSCGGLLVNYLDVVIQKIASDLEKAEKDLADAIADGDAALDEKITNLNATLKNAIDAYKAADGALKQELTTKIEAADATLDAAIKAVQKNLDDAKNELQNAINANETDIEDKVTKLNAALESAKAALEKADADNKAALEKNIDDADATLDKAIKAVQKNLDDAKAELDKAIADLDAAMKQGDADLSTEIANLNTALTNAKAALEKADVDNKAELEKKIDDADATLDKAIKAVQKNLDDLKAQLEKADVDNKAALEAKDAELEEKADELQTFIIIVCVISGVAFCGCGTLAVFYFIDKKKKI